MGRVEGFDEVPLSLQALTSQTSKAQGCLPALISSAGALGASDRGMEPHSVSFPVSHGRWSQDKYLVHARPSRALPQNHTACQMNVRSCGLGRVWSRKEGLREVGNQGTDGELVQSCPSSQRQWPRSVFRHPELPAASGTLSTLPTSSPEDVLSLSRGW